MERLVFNTAEHKLEELEKYGFVKYGNDYAKHAKNYYETHIYINSNGKVFLSYYESTSIDEALCILYDLIKDGLVVKEKKNDKN